MFCFVAGCVALLRSGFKTALACFDQDSNDQQRHSSVARRIQTFRWVFFCCYYFLRLPSFADVQAEHEVQR